MFLDKLRVLAGHSRKINWLWPLFITIAVLLIIIVRSWHVLPTEDMDRPGSWWIRVLLFSKIDSCQVETSAGFTVELLDGAKKTFNSGDDFQITCDANGFKVGTDIFPGGQILIRPGEPYIFAINGMKFRGNLRFVAFEDGRFDAVNVVPIEAYLNGVIGAEMPRYWKAEALKVQAITSRTYCLYYKNTYGTDRHYDIRRTQANQVYMGLAKEYNATRNAAHETRGQVLTSGNRVFPAYFGSSCGGHTEDSSEVFGKYFESVKGVACPYCVDVARKSQFFWKPAEFTTEELTSRLAERYESVKPLGEIVGIEPRRRSDYGQYSRWTSVRLIGAAGKSITLRGEDFRLALDPTGLKIKSTIFELTKIKGKWVFYGGRGFGHGVGLCQCGTEKLAKDGKTATEILKYYYPGAEITKIY